MDSVDTVPEPFEDVSQPQPRERREPRWLQQQARANWRRLVEALVHRDSMAPSGKQGCARKAGHACTDDGNVEYAAQCMRTTVRVQPNSEYAATAQTSYVSCGATASRCTCDFLRFI